MRPDSLKPIVTTPMKAVKAECRDCLGDYYIDCLSEVCYLAKNLRYMDRIKKHCAHCSPNWNVDNCEMENCPLFPYRFGKNPNRVSGGKKCNVDHLEEYKYGR